MQTTVFPPGSKRLETDSKNGDLIGAVSALSRLYLGHYFPDRAEFVSSGYVSLLFQNLKSK